MHYSNEKNLYKIGLGLLVILIVGLSYLWVSSMSEISALKKNYEEEYKELVVEYYSCTDLLSGSKENIWDAWGIIGDSYVIWDNDYPYEDLKDALYNLGEAYDLLYDTHQKIERDAPTQIF